MNLFEFNKIAGAILGTLTIILGVNVIVTEVFKQEKPEKPGLEVAVKEPAAGGGAAAGGAAGGGVETLLATADPVKGEAAAKKCAACHSFDKGGAAKLGPNLYGVVGQKHAHQQGFGYSDAMKKTSDKTWDFAAMDKWLENPKGYIQGTSMAFAGIKDPQERANLVAYLNKNSDSPKELPKAAAGDAPAAAAGGAPAAAAGGAPAAGGGEAAGGGFAAKVAAADPKKGETAVKKCAACHSFDKGGPAKVGPNLYGVMGLKHAHQEGFGYSSAMQGTKDKSWDVEAMNKWLENPKGYIPGTSMAFAGIKSEDERAAIIAYLNKNSDSPKDLGGGAAAGGDKKTDAAPAAGAEPKKEEQAAAPAAAPAPAAPAAGAEPKKDEQAAAPAAAPAPPGGDEPIEARLAAADPAKGQQAITQQCAVCHTLKKGEEASAGPNLYGVVGAKHAHQEGFEYSDAIKGKPGPWNFAELDAWLKKPDEYAPGTMMAFPGVEDPKVRADMIAWLNKNSDSPAPVPGAK